MSNFKVGDRVYVDGYTTHNDRGEKVHVKGTGVISSTQFAPDVYSVKMDKPYINQHYCTTTFFSALPHELFTIKKEEELRMTNLAPRKDTKIIIYTKGNRTFAKVIVGKRTVETECAVCSHDDVFSIFTGAQIALARLAYKNNAKPALSKAALDKALKNFEIIE